MTIYSQVGRRPVQGADRSMKNYAVADIAPKLAVMWDATAANIDGCAAPTTGQSTDKTCGITIDTIKAGSTGRVAQGGTAVAVSNATLAAGDSVDIDTTAGNEGKVKAHAAGAKSLGIACHAAVAGDDVEILIGVCPNA